MSTVNEQLAVDMARACGIETDTEPTEGHTYVFDQGEEPWVLTVTTPDQAVYAEAVDYTQKMMRGRARRWVGVHYWRPDRHIVLAGERGWLVGPMNAYATWTSARIKLVCATDLIPQKG